MRVAVDHLGGGELGRLAARTFGLAAADRDKPAGDRRRKAALEYNVSLERFRKHHELVVIGQVAEKIMELCHPLGPDPQASRQAIAEVIVARIRGAGGTALAAG